MEGWMVKLLMYSKSIAFVFYMAFFGGKQLLLYQVNRQMLCMYKFFIVVTLST